MLKQRFSRVCPCEASSERASAMPRGRRGDSARWTRRLPPRAKAPLQHSSFIPGIIKEPKIDGIWTAGILPARYRRSKSHRFLAL
ncbi:MAG: hypothetical protein GY801_02605 [bacterium]|nr:hypothetical protein [bacterium]